MGKIKVVVEVDEESFKFAKEWKTKKYSINHGWWLTHDDIIYMLANGIPLPKECGRLIDADKFLKDNEAYTGFILDSRFFGGKNAYKDTLEDLVNEADTIIEAYKEV